MNNLIIPYRGNMGVQTTPPFVNTYSLDFDGVDEYVDLGSGLDIFQYNIGQSYSVSLWYKSTTSTSFDTIVNFGSNTYKFSLVTGLNGTISFGAGNSTSITYINKWLPTSGVINDGNWHHICIVQDSSSNSVNLTAYVDGSASGSSPGGTSAFVETNNRIANGYYSGFEGGIDEVAIFDTALTPTEITSIAAGTTDLSLLTTPPLAWIRMGDNGAYKSPQWLLPSNENKDKESNYSLSFDGMDDYIDLGSDSSLDIFGSDFTISLWAKWGAQTTNSNGLINFAANTNKAVITLGFSSQYGKISFGTGSASTVGILYDCGSGYDDNNWHHIMCTLQGSTRTVFVDGVDISSTGSGSSIGVGSNNDIGNRARSRYFLGYIDEVSIFNEVVDIADVWNNSGEPIDVSAVSGIVSYYKMGEEATFSGGVWTVPDQVGSNDGTSNAMTIEDRVGDAPSSKNNALSYNMDLVDRVEDTP